MQANEGDQLLMHGRTVGRGDRSARILEVLGSNGEPPYRIRFDDGHEAVMAPGPDSEVRENDHRPLTG